MVRLNSVLSTASWCDESLSAVVATQIVRLNGSTIFLPIISSDLSKLSSWSSGGNNGLCDSSKADGRFAGSCWRREVMTTEVHLETSASPWPDDLLCCWRVLNGSQSSGKNIPGLLRFSRTLIRSAPVLKA